MLGSEWGHNLAHLAASNLIRKPMNQFRIQLGMPRCVYHKLNDPDVAPREHLVRALGGPIFNLMVLPFAWAAKRMTKKDSLAGVTARTAYDTNLFLSMVSLLPIPGIDGGPILKWSLVERGKTIPEADEVIRKSNGPLALFLGLFSSGAFFKKKTLLGLFSLMLGGISLSVYMGWLKEEEISI
jgi:Zn-dependent protease